MSHDMTAGVNDGQGTHFLPDGADDAPDESKGVAGPVHPASRPAPAVTHPMTETKRAVGRELWSRCTKTSFGRCNDGRMEPWRGSDGHSGSEWFYTCDRCGVTQ